MASFWAASAARSIANSKQVYGGLLLSATTATLAATASPPSAFTSDCTKCEQEELKTKLKIVPKVNLKTRVCIYFLQLVHEIEKACIAFRLARFSI